MLSAQGKRRERSALAGGSQGCRRRRRPSARMPVRCRQPPTADALCPSFRFSCGTFEDMFLSLLQQQGEEWQLYRAFKGELPTVSELAACHSVVITGSV